jgi:hypothetical protein
MVSKYDKPFTLSGNQRLRARCKFAEKGQKAIEFLVKPRRKGGPWQNLYEDGEFLCREK